MLKEFLKDLARWADDPMTQSVMIGVGVWLAFEILAAQQRKTAAHARHLRLHGDRLRELELTAERHGKAVDSLLRMDRRLGDVSRETSPVDPYSVLAENA